MGWVLGNIGGKSTILFLGWCTEKRHTGQRCCILAVLVHHHLTICGVIEVSISLLGKGRILFKKCRERDYTVCFGDITYICI